MTKLRLSRTSTFSLLMVLITLLSVSLTIAPDAAHILILRYAHNFSDAEIAKLLGLSRTTVAVRLFRSRARLRKLMGD